VPKATTRRFFEIDGLDLGGLLAVELFTTVIPLILIGFGWASNFSTQLSFGDLLIKLFGLSGEEAQLVRDTFGTGASLKSTWTVVGLGSFLIWGIPMSWQVAKTWAAAWRRERFPLVHETWRGALWFALFLGTQAAAVRISVGHVHGIADIALNLLGLLPSFVLWSFTPVLLIRNGWVGWRHLMWCGLAGVLIDAVLARIVTRVLIPLLLKGWVGFGPIGFAMTLMTWCGVIAVMWVATACLAAVLWERRAPEQLVIGAQDAPLAT